jgi:hypothetical protein
VLHLLCALALAASPDLPNPAPTEALSFSVFNPPAVVSFDEPRDEKPASRGVPQASLLLVVGSALLVVAASSRRLRRLVPAARG